MATENLVTQSIIDRLNAIPRSEFDTVGFQEGGKDYSMDPNGLISVRDVGAKPTDQVQVFDQTGNFLASHAVEQRSDFVQAINQAGRVGIPAIIGASLLGPAGTGLFNAPVASAVGTGGSTLLQGGSIEDALKAAALAGLTAYGVQGLMGGVGTGAETFGAEDLTIYDDIRQLKAIGIPDSQISNIVEASYNVTPTFAADAINQVAASTVAPATTETVTLAGERLFNPVTLTAPVAATLPSTFVAEPVMVQSQNLPQTTVNVEDLLSVLAPAVVPALAPIPAPVPAPTPAPASERVEVTDIRLLPPAPGPIVPFVPTPAPVPSSVPMPAPAPAPAPAVEQVEVVEKLDKKVDTPIIPLGSAVLAPLPPISPEVTAELPRPTQPTDNRSLFSPSDILRLIGLFGGLGAGASLANMGSTNVLPPPSDTQLGTTTPQFGSDYYAAVQQYYNAYMPQTPRNVATPLQQWYENKFGA